MKILNNYIEVKELKDNLIDDGITIKYDDTSPYIYASIINYDKDLKSMLHDEEKSYSIILCRRISKIPIQGHYFVHKSDVLALLTTSEYNKLKGGN